MYRGPRIQTSFVAFAILCVFAFRTQAVAPSNPVVLDVPERADSTPWVAASGSFVAVAWGAGSSGKTDVFVAVSRDGGSTFGRPAQVNRMSGEARLGGEMPPRIALVAKPGVSIPEIVVVWTARGVVTEIKAARSRDAGRTFDVPVTVQSNGAAGDRGWPAVAVDRQGGIHVIWLDHRGLAAERTAGAGHAAHRRGTEHDGVAMAQKSGLYYAAVARKAPQERELTRSVCYCCKTALAVAPNGSLYAAWRHVYPGNLRDIAFAVSRDGGRSFSAPARVSEDKWAINGCPDDGPAVAVDPRGRIHLVWPTVIDGANPQGALFYASTQDGRRFTPRVRIPTLGGLRPAHPQIVIDRRGRIFVAWDESVEDQRLVAVRQLKPNAGSGPEFGEAVRLSVNKPAMYPVLAATSRGLLAVWTATGEQSRVEARTVAMP